MSHASDMTEGKPLRLLVQFAVPMLLANILQLFYTLADSAVIGRLIGVEAFASVGLSSALYWMVLGANIAVTHGFGVIFGHRFGAKDIVGLRAVFTTAAILTAAAGALFAIAGVLFSKTALSLLNTPKELLGTATLYLRFLLGGIPITFAYNLLSDLLRAMGDSKTPLRAMIFSTLLNIALDIALVIPFRVAGVAVATLLAQVVACAYCAAVLQKTGIFKGAWRNFTWEKSIVRELLRIGLPLGLRNVVAEAGGLVVQYHINGYGMHFVAGITSAKRMFSLLVIVAGAIEAAVAIFVAQNYGAGCPDRMKQGVAVGRRLMLVSAAIIAVFVLVFGRLMLGLLVEGDQIESVLSAGQRQINVLACGLPLFCLLVLYRAAIQSVGNTLIPMLSGFLESLMRIASVLLLTPFFGAWGVYLSDLAGWAAAVPLLIWSYIVIFRRKQLL